AEQAIEAVLHAPHQSMTRQVEEISPHVPRHSFPRRFGPRLRCLIRRDAAVSCLCHGRPPIVQRLIRDTSTELHVTLEPTSRERLWGQAERHADIPVIRACGVMWAVRVQFAGGGASCTESTKWRHSASVFGLPSESSAPHDSDPAEVYCVHIGRARTTISNRGMVIWNRE